MIKSATGKIGFDQIDIQTTRSFNGFQDGSFGDLVKHHPLIRNVTCFAILFQQLTDMPANGLTFSVRVSGQNKPVCPVQGFADVTDTLAT